MWKNASITNACLMSVAKNTCRAFFRIFKREEIRDFINHAFVPERSLRFEYLIYTALIQSLGCVASQS